MGEVKTVELISEEDFKKMITRNKELEVDYDRSIKKVIELKEENIKLKNLIAKLECERMGL